MWQVGSGAAWPCLGRLQAVPAASTAMVHTHLVEIGNLGGLMCCMRLEIRSTNPSCAPQGRHPGKVVLRTDNHPCKGGCAFQLTCLAQVIYQLGAHLENYQLSPAACTQPCHGTKMHSSTRLGWCSRLDADQWHWCASMHTFAKQQVVAFDGE